MKTPPPRDILHVEGTDDERVLTELIARHIVSESHRGIMQMEGIEKLIASIPASIKSYRHYGVVVDADTAPHTIWRRLTGAFNKGGVQIPVKIPPNGLVQPHPIDPEGRIGIWMMPDNGGGGMLEDFLANLIPPEDKCWPHADEAARRAISLGAPLKEAHLSKGILHTWLAWREQPGMRLAQALNRRQFSPEAEISDRFISWYKELFFGST